MYTQSPHTHHTMGKEAFIAETERWNSLTYEQQQKEREELFKEDWQRMKEDSERKRKAMEERSAKGAEDAYVYSDKVGTMENSEATVIWLAVMGVGLIFKERWFIWILATIIWLCFINRYSIRKWKWDNGGKEQYYQRLHDITKGDKKNE